MEGWLDMAFDLADLAAQIALPRFGRGALHATVKHDGSPVTDVDLAVERRLRGEIARRCPEHSVVGEELGVSGDGAWRWYVDPIDGTAPYLAGDRSWMTLIALTRDGEIVVGVADAPARGERWWASRGGGAYCNGSPLRVSTGTALEQATVADDWRRSIAGGVADGPLGALAASGGSTYPFRHHSFLAVAAGRADVAVVSKCGPWDYAAPKLIVEEAGGTFTDFAGQPNIDAGRAVVTNGHVHREVLDLLSPFRTDTEDG